MKLPKKGDALIIVGMISCIMSLIVPLISFSSSESLMFPVMLMCLQLSIIIIALGNYSERKETVNRRLLA